MKITWREYIDSAKDDNEFTNRCDEFYKEYMTSGVKQDKTENQLKMF